MAVPRRSTILSAVASCSVALALAAPTAGAVPTPPAAAPVPSAAAAVPAGAVPVPSVAAAVSPAAAPVPSATADRPAQPGTSTLSDLFGVYNTAVDGLRAAGMQPFLYPTASAYCLNGTSLGLAPAVAAAVPGPWPRTTIAIPGLDLTAVKSGQTMFTFVPYGLGQDGPDTTGMQVAWLNLTSGRGGMASMGPLSSVFGAMIPAEVPAVLRPMAERAIQDFFFAALPMGGVRAVPVDTGQGTVLAAVFGTVENGGKSCFFLPTVGITEVP
ncbi:hypothetical protein NONI108955_22055 [Nocardia ninae]|uniref:hypothetical protein n=1 Tax=Nocardia ninae TaxID=356145 RepID=UPI001FE5C4C6|nr:hypothetical protein [Nocardia ninae]